MADTGEQDDRVLVLADDTSRERTGGIDWEDTPYRHLQVRDVELVGRLEHQLTDETELLVLDGDDRLVHRAMTAVRCVKGVRAQGIRWCPVRTGGFDRTARDLGMPKASGKFLRRVASWLEGDRRPVERRRTLKVDGSSLERPLVGLTFGGGACFEVVEAMHRGGEGVVGFGRTVGELVREVTTKGGEGLGVESARLAVDYEPRSETLGYLLASGLETSWFGVDFGAEPGVRMTLGDRPRKLIGRLARDRALPSLMRDTGEDFDCVHLDWSGGFALDGELYAPEAPYALEIAEGPSVNFAAI